MLLRIEDTDRERNNPEAVAAIVDGLKWLELNWDGETVSQFARAHRHRQVAEELLASGHAYKCWLTPAELDAMRESGAGGEAAAHHPLAVARARSRRGAGRRAARHPPQGAARGRDRHRRSGAGPRRVRQQGARRPHHPAQRRQPDLQSRRRRRRPRHAGDAYHPRRRSPDQCRAADADLPGDGLGRADLRARAAHPRSRRRQAVEASRRARHRGLQGDGLPAGGACATTWCASAGATATTRSCRPRRWSTGSTRSTSTARRRASTSPSSRTSTATTSATPTTRSCCNRIEDLLPYLPGGAGIVGAARRQHAGEVPASPCRASRSAPRRWSSSSTAPTSCSPTGRCALDEKAQKLLDAEGRQRLADMLPKLEAAGRWKASELEEIVRTYAEATGAKLGKVAQPLRAALTGKIGVAAGVRRHGRARPRRSPGPHPRPGRLEPQSERSRGGVVRRLTVP